MGGGEGKNHNIKHQPHTALDGRMDSETRGGEGTGIRERHPRSFVTV